MKTSMNVLLTGASGTIGTEVLQQLIQLEHIRLTVFDVKNARTKKLFAPYKNQINIVWGDISNEEDVSRIPAKLDAAIHLAAIIPPLADAKPELARKVNIIGTRNIIQHLQNTSPEAFLLYSSSVAVYGDHIQNPYISVTDPLNARTEDIYAQTKIESENLIQHSTLSWSIFRLTAIMKNHKMTKLMFHMPLSTRMEICTPRDTARAFTEGLKHRSELSGRIFNLGGGERCCISYREFLERSFHLFGLGAVNFPDHAFAERNFHCGIYTDGNMLEDIVHFRNDTIDSYFIDVSRSISFTKWFLSSMFSSIIKQILLNQSEPLKAFKSKNENKMNLFFFPKKNPVSVLHS
ncbi:MAG: NAD(P)-dependent oxidoreductase [Paludibacter sp.]|nr:NAD(P)-dependent oxidoreductase [Paludibacter sp.]